MPVSGTVTPVTIADEYSSIFSRTGEKNKSHHMRRYSNSFRFGV
jgi:hypothetical protein